MGFIVNMVSSNIMSAYVGLYPTHFLVSINSVCGLNITARDTAFEPDTADRRGYNMYTYALTIL